MPISASRVLRAFRYAVFFDGVDDYIVVPHNPSVSLTRWTIQVWFNSLPTLAGMGLVTKGFDAWENYELLVYGHVRAYHVATRFTDGYRDAPTTPSVIDFSTWVFASYSYDPSMGKRVYHNNSLIYSDSQYRIPMENTYDMLVGLERGTLRYFNGYIARVLIYSRALSDSEIRFNYSNPDNPIRNGLVLWLQAHPDNIKDIDGDGVPEWLDLSGFNNHGKIYGARLVELIRTPVR
jgi:hypothetical protein